MIKYVLGESLELTVFDVTRYVRGAATMDVYRRLAQEKQKLFPGRWELTDKQIEKMVRYAGKLKKSKK